MRSFGVYCRPTLARGSPLKGVTMTVLGLIFGIVGSDIETGTPRLTFGLLQLYDGVEIAALALGLFGIAEFMQSVNQVVTINAAYTNVRLPEKLDAATRLWIAAEGWNGEIHQASWRLTQNP